MQPPVNRSRYAFHLPGPKLRGVLVAAGVAVFGLIALQASHAGTATVTGEAETGTVNGNAAAVNDANASGGQAVKFGAAVVNAPATPTGLVTITGGTSIALRWSPSAPGNNGISQYNIFRDGNQVATISPGGFHADFPEKDGDGYIDKNVRSGSRYSYQVQAVGANGATSPKSASISATQPTNTSPTPTFTYDLGGATDLDSYMKNTVIPFLQIWYPKVADRDAYPDYTPYTSIKLVLDPNNANILDTHLEDGHITANTSFIRDNLNSHDKVLGAWLHEATHSIQGQASSAGNDGMGWMHEGGADYSREYILHDRDPVKPFSDGNYNTYYTDGYSPASYLINYIQTHYNSNYLRQVTVHGHNHQLTANDVLFNGKNIDEVWDEMLGLPSHTGPVSSKDSGKCLDINAAGVDLGTKVQIWDCNDSVQQKMTAQPTGNNTVLLHVLGMCLDIQNAGTANGTPVWLYDCSGSVAQQWNIMPDGSLVNPNSGRCLDITGAGSGGANGTQMEIWDCNGGNWQKWNFPAGTPQLSGLGPITFRSNTSKCLDDPSGNTASGTQLQVWDCNGQSPQAWSLLKRSDGNYTISVLGKCMDAASAGTTNGTVVWIWDCTGSIAQIWQPQANGSLKNVNSGKCLDTSTKAVANSALLQLNDCNGSASQIFNFPGSVSNSRLQQSLPHQKATASDAIR